MSEQTLSDRVAELERERVAAIAERDNAVRIGTQYRTLWRLQEARADAAEARLADAERRGAREALVRVFDAANISARPLTLNDLATALGLKDYSHSGLADALFAAVRAECAAKVDGVRSENGSIAEQAAIERIQNPLFNRWPIELSDAEDAAMKAMLDSHHCGAPDEDDGKYCGGCVSLAWAIVRASRIKGAEEYKAAHPATLEAQP